MIVRNYNKKANVLQNFSFSGHLIFNVHNQRDEEIKIGKYLLMEF
jgi:hypothetical protein